MISIVLVGSYSSSFEGFSTLVFSFGTLKSDFEIVLVFVFKNFDGWLLTTSSMGCSEANSIGTQCSKN